MPRLSKRAAQARSAAQGARNSGSKRPRVQQDPERHAMQHQVDTVEVAEQAGNTAPDAPSESVDVELLLIEDALEALTRDAEARDNSGVAAVSWNEVAVLRAKWKSHCTHILQNIRACCVCGSAYLGEPRSQPPISRVHATFGDIDVPPYAFKNADMADFVVSGDAWWACHRCIEHPERGNLVPLYTPAFKRAWLAIHPCQHTYLSMLNVDVDLKAKYDSHVYSGNFSGAGLLDGPLASLSLPAVEEAADFGALRHVLTISKAANPLFAEFLTMLEVDNCSGVPVLGPSAIEKLLGNARMRGPIEDMERYGSSAKSMAIVTTNRSHELRNQTVLLAGMVHYHCGRVERLFTNAIGEPVDGPLKDVITAEALMFPALFPQGYGFYRPLFRGFSLSDYCHMRATAWCSPFTLTPAYMLFLYNMKLSHQIASSVKEVVLERDIRKYMRDNSATRAEGVRNACKSNVPSTVQGMPSYHRTKLQELLVRVKQHGMPKLFLTLTMDETSELRWQEIADLEGFLEVFNSPSTMTAKKFKDAPVECARIFVKKLKILMNSYLLSGPEILGRLKHWLTRYEVQGRGSLHAHICLWVDDTDIERVSDEICGAVPAEYCVQTRDWVLPEDAHQRTLAEIVIRKQMHRCRPTGCRSGGDNSCKYRFPFAPHPRKTEYSAELQRFLYYRPQPPDGYTEHEYGPHRNVVPYHPTILLLWNAHMNIQRVTNQAWSLYLLKYALKGEPSGKITLDTTTAAALGLTHLSDAQLEVISSLVLTRPVSVTEAALFLLGEEIVQAADAVAYIDTRIRADRATMVLPHANTHVLAAIDHYVARPAAVEDFTLCEYFRTHVVTKTTYTGSRGHVSIGQDANGTNVYRLPTPRLVRFTDYHPRHSPEGFCYNLLLQHRCYRSEDDMIRPAVNQAGSYLRECQMTGLLDTPEKWEAAVGEYAKRHLYTQEKLHDLIIESSTGLTFNADVEQLGAFDGTHQAEVVQRQQLLDAIHHAEATDWIPTGLPPPTEEQERIIEEVCSAPSGLFKIGGGPGRGKSVLLKHLVANFGSMGHGVLVCASTGSAAQLLGIPGACTFHRAVGLGQQGTYANTLPPTDPRYRRLKATAVFIVEEISMLSNQVLNAGMANLRSVWGYSAGTDWIASTGKKVIFVGDTGQLPPVCKHLRFYDCERRDRRSCGVCFKCHVSQNDYYKRATALQLTEPLRQLADPDFTAFLDVCRDGRPTQEEIDTCLERCVLDADQLQHLLSQKAPVTIVATHRQDVNAYNEAAMQQLFGSSAITLSVRCKRPPSDKLRKFVDDKQFHTLPTVAIGARVMFTDNQYMQEGAANGTTGTVVGLVTARGIPCSSEMQLAAILVNLDLAPHNVVRVTRSKRANMYEGNASFWKSTFPLTLCYALTAHKCQGCTIRNNCLLDVRKAFCPGMLYVMLSRVTTRETLFLKRRLTPFDFEPVPAACLT